ncbi:ABC transporter substrate-binding protein [Bifidobacterium aquikefiri]|uniref:ABC transporter substrate-binding protein n=1 Tax=Bifidobacterium aquikefiri TaxID=1653207 RepID=UPI0039EC0DB8
MTNLTVKKILCVASLGVLLVGMLSACSQSGNTTASGEYEFGRIELPVNDGSLCGGPTYIALEKGFFKEEGLDVVLTASDAEARKVGLNNGTYPLVNGDFQFFQSIENGVKIKIVDGLHNGCIKFLVRPDSTISKPEDIIGKKIAINEVGDTPHQVVSMWLEEGGVSADPADGEVEFLPFADANLQFEALDKGEVDVVAAWDPVGSIKEQEGPAKVIFDLSKEEGFKDRFCCFLFASEKTLEAEPKKVAALIRAYHKAETWIAHNPIEAVKIIAEKNYSQIDDSGIAETLLKDYQYMDHSMEVSDDRNPKTDVEYFAEKLHNIGYLNSDPKQFTDDVFVEVDLEQ